MKFDVTNTRVEVDVAEELGPDNVTASPTQVCLELQHTQALIQPQLPLVLRIHSLACPVDHSTPHRSFRIAKDRMWDDEDNNPYGSFARHDSNSSDVPGLASPTARKMHMAYLGHDQESELTY
jgi:hypothetical protein